jgi:ABC-type Fe3+/spermidine/putrescine transport system ATPase subunit
MRIGAGDPTLIHNRTSGEILVEGKDLRQVPPQKRNIGMVFQDYALFPHLSVFDNVAFGLKPRKVSWDEIARRVPQALNAVRLGTLADRLPAAMSGGQQQRIGLARAMVINPQLLLMDEPLSNLDAKLRIELREKIRDIQKQVGIATIYVTHDQEEALAISDRICVMSNGRVEQVGSPQEIYGDPQTRFVAGFVGTINTLQRGPVLNEVLAKLGLGTVAQTHPGANWVVRPENLTSAGTASLRGEPMAEITGAVLKYTYLGREAHLLIKTELGNLMSPIPIVRRFASPAMH